MTASAVTWYAARASGTVAYLLLTVAVVLGIALAGKVRLKRWPRFAVEDVHRFAGLLVGVFIAVHVLTLAADTVVPFSVRDLVVPFSTSYRPFWTGLGIVAAELLLALAVVNALRGHIPRKVWRQLHRLNLVVWAAATGHGIVGGTDGGSLWFAALYISSVAAVSLALLGRSPAAAPPNGESATQSLPAP